MNPLTSRALWAALSLPLFACGAAAPGPGSALSAAGGLTPAAALSTPRAAHASTVSGADLLLIGGCVRDGCDPGPASATVDIIGPDGARRIGRLGQPRVQPSAAVLPDGRVLVIGGWVNGRVAASTELFDPRNGASSPGPTLATPRSSAMVTPLKDGRVLIAGGFDGTWPLATAEIYDPATGALRPTGGLLHARSGATATRLADGRVLIAGGGTGDREDRVALASAELYDPAAGAFRETGALSEPRYKHGAVALPDGEVLVIGGADQRDYTGKISTVERFDPRTGRWRLAGRLTRGRFKLADASVLLPTGKVLVAGDSEQPELFDPATGQAALLPTSLEGRWNYLTAAWVGGRVVLAGGYTEGTIRLSSRVWTGAL